MSSVKKSAGLLVGLLTAGCFACVALAATAKASSRGAAWYLMAPPFTAGDPPGALQLQAPLSRWLEMDSAATAAGCDEQRDNMIRMYRSADVTSPATQFKLLLYHYAVCVCSADARLNARAPRRPAQAFFSPAGGNAAANSSNGPLVPSGSDFASEPPDPGGSGWPTTDQIPVTLMLFGLAAIAACGSLGGWFLEPGRARRVGQDGGRPMRLLRWRRLLPPVLDAQLGQPAELAHVRRHQNQFVGKRNAGDKASYAPIDARSRAVLWAAARSNASSWTAPKKASITGPNRRETGVELQHHARFHVSRGSS
ncbi:MAG TPA: hypothetical protein VFB33_07960 [Candidatus Binataceae bacterium]|nr:hypothetical protein [Candidatus Binataceae bacterium]